MRVAIAVLATAWEGVLAWCAGFVAVSTAITVAVGLATYLVNLFRGLIKHHEAVLAMPVVQTKLDEVLRWQEHHDREFREHIKEDRDAFAAVKKSQTDAADHLTGVVSQLERSVQALDRTTVQLKTRAEVEAEYDEQRHPRRRHSDRG